MSSANVRPIFNAFVVLVAENMTVVEDTELAPFRYTVVVPDAPPEYETVYILHEAVVEAVAVLRPLLPFAI
jgi:hypothetical protein